MSKTLVLMTCGGTFDKSRFTRVGKFVCGAPQAKRIMAGAGLSAKVARIVKIMNKDSLDMDDADRAQVVAAVRKETARRIVIIHGTDTMALTGRLLAQEIRTKTVILTGAMLPAVFSGSDADYNLGFAMGSALNQPAGVWIAMHGTLFAATKVVEDRARGRFEVSVPTPTKCS